MTVSFDNVIEKVSYGVGNMTGLVSSVSPATSTVLTAVKAGARGSKAYKSFLMGGFFNPAFYAHSASAALSGASFACQCSSYICPPLALPLFGFSQMSGAFGDGIESNLGISTYFF